MIILPFTINSQLCLMLISNKKNHFIWHEFLTNSCEIFSQKILDIENICARFCKIKYYAVEMDFVWMSSEYSFQMNLMWIFYVKIKSMWRTIAQVIEMFQKFDVNLKNQKCEILSHFNQFFFSQLHSFDQKTCIIII